MVLLPSPLVVFGLQFITWFSLLYKKWSKFCMASISACLEILRTLTPADFLYFYAAKKRLLVVTPLFKPLFSVSFNFSWSMPKISIIFTKISRFSLINPYLPSSLSFSKTILISVNLPFLVFSSIFGPYIITINPKTHIIPQQTFMPFIWSLMAFS